MEAQRDMPGKRPWWLGPLAAWLPLLLAPRLLVSAGVVDPSPVTSGPGNVAFATVLAAYYLYLAWRQHRKNDES